MTASSSEQRYVYLDHAATTPMHPGAVEAMSPFYTTHFANPSGSHRFSRKVRTAVDDARELIADIVGCAPGEVVFTGGGTESDNTAICSVAEGRAWCSAAEHHAVLHAVERRRGKVVGCDAAGRIHLEELGEQLAVAAIGHDEPGLVSVMAVNNEVGSITDVSAVASVVRRHAPSAVVHTDAVQAPNWLDLRTITPHVDLLSLSAHKFGGPKGVGAIVVRKGTALRPLLVGGGQERELRSGTHNVAGIVGMAEALRLTDSERTTANQRIAALRDELVRRIVDAIPDAVETVDRAHKVAGSAHLCFPGVENESLLFLLDEAGVCASAASACASGAMEPSHVLASMGVPRHLAGGALRLTLGHQSTAADVHLGAEAVIAAVRQLRIAAVT
jgi:cysteine desulfurase